jgi:hypothetical protein
MINLIAGAATIFSFVSLSEDNPVGQWRVIAIASVVIFNVWLVIVTIRQERDLRRLGKIEQDFLNSWSELREREQNIA